MNIAPELAAHLRFRERILSEYPAIDEETLADTLQGLTNLDEMLLAALRQAHADECMVEAIEKRIGDLEARADRLSRRAQKLREQVAAAMAEAGIRKLAAPDMTVSLRPTPRNVIVTDEAAIPADYFVQPPPRLDKRLVRKALEEGHPVPGCALGNGGVTVSVRVV